MFGQSCEVAIAVLGNSLKFAWDLSKSSFEAITEVGTDRLGPVMVCTDIFLLSPLIGKKALTKNLASTTVIELSVVAETCTFASHRHWCWRTCVCLVLYRTVLRSGRFEWPYSRQFFFRRRNLFYTMLQAMRWLYTCKEGQHYWCRALVI